MKTKSSTLSPDTLLAISGVLRAMRETGDLLLGALEADAWSDETARGAELRLHNAAVAMSLFVGPDVERELPPDVVDLAEWRHVHHALAGAVR